MSIRASNNIQAQVDISPIIERAIGDQQCIMEISGSSQHSIPVTWIGNSFFVNKTFSANGTDKYIISAGDTVLFSGILGNLFCSEVIPENATFTIASIKLETI